MRVAVCPNEADAGAELTVTVRASCSHGCDLTGQSVAIHNPDGTVLSAAELAHHDGEAFVTSALVFRAPLRVGEHTYRTILAAHEKDGVVHNETTAAFTFAVQPHAVNVNVWGFPSAIAAGGRFTFTVGIKCSAGCNLAGEPVIVLDHNGAHVTTVALRDAVWPGTGALYFAEAEVQAPPLTGDYRWQVATAERQAEIPHAAGAFTFPVKVVSPSDHEVTVEACDGETQALINGAHVLLYPYRALTDHRGVARVKVAKGRYRLVVSGFHYIAHQAIVNVADDVTVQVELAAEPEGQEDYR